jgi:hypothetical protein
VFAPFSDQGPWVRQKNPGEHKVRPYDSIGQLLPPY